MSKAAAGLWQYGLPALLILAVPALTPQSCAGEASALLTSPAPSRQSTGATPGKPADGTLILLGGAPSERTAPRADSPAGVPSWSGTDPILRKSGSMAPGWDAIAPTALGASRSGRSPPQLSLL